MIVQIQIGGVWVSFGDPFATNKPEPFYPYLLSVEQIQDSTGQETGASGFVLHLKAQRLLGLKLRKPVKILTPELELRFEGVIGRIAYKEAITVTVEA